MEIIWEKSISSSRDHHRHPSFSSTLLDQIYRSIDDSSSNNHHASLHHDLDISSVYHRSSIAADFDRYRRRRTTTEPLFLKYCNSSSSDSSGFSSSESGRSKSSVSPPPPPKPIRTSVEKPSSKKELGGFLRTKTKALKIYTDLKKVKQPISPGGRLATFLNSLFTSAVTNPKKQKKTSSTSVAEPNSASTCSSRSCLSKTPSSSGKSKRYVRFCPVDVIHDQDSSIIPMPCAYGYKDTKRDRHVIEEENRRAIEAAKNLLRTCENNKNHLALSTTTPYQDDEEDDDAASYDSSDLFELENLSTIGIKRYQEELPVYETTRLDTNRAIATGFIV